MKKILAALAAFGVLAPLASYAAGSGASEFATLAGAFIQSDILPAFWVVAGLAIVATVGFMVYRLVSRRIAGVK